MPWRSGLSAIAALVIWAFVVALGSGSAAGRPVQGQAAYAPQCPDAQFPAARDPSNPLDLAQSPGADPLHGAHLFVNGPAHGTAAGAIEQLLGVNPASYPDSYSWTQFQQDLGPGGSLHQKLVGHASLAREVSLLEKIADQQETQSISLYAAGGGPGAIFGQVQKLLCHNLTADHTPHTVPVFSTLFVFPKGKFCPTLKEIQANGPTFQRQIDELAAGTGRHPVVYLLEINGVGSTPCLTPAALRAWEADLRYEIIQMTALPHTVVYLEASSSDQLSPPQVARIITDVCVVKVHGVATNVCALMRGFFTNDTHFNWSSHEIAWANKISHALGQLIRQETHTSYTAHYVVNTAQNGRGPKRNPHPAQQGVEDLCNPPGRGLGRIPTANTAPTFDGRTFPLLDAFLWTGTPGRSHNSDCHPGDAAAGVFFTRFALELAANANQQLGPGYPSSPY